MTSSAIANLNAKFAETRAAKYFDLEGRGSTLSKEILGGFTTFLTLAYILPVNALILSLSGGPCECPEDDPFCMYGQNENRVAYDECLEDIRLQLITTTALAAMGSCFLMGLTANLPFALAPGMGLNAYFTYDVVGFKGSGDIAWRTAITAILIEGIIFFILTVTGVRESLTKRIPDTIKYSVTGGIGLFLSIIGLTTAEGIGLVAYDIATGLTLGGCPPEKRNPVYYCPEKDIAQGQGASVSVVQLGDAFFGDLDDFFDNTTFTPLGVCLSEPQQSYTCDTYDGQMTSLTTWVGIIGICIMGILLSRKVRGAVSIGIVFVTLISWIPGTSISYFDDDVQPFGENRLDYFKNVVYLKTIPDIAAQYDFSGFSDGSLILAVFTFLYVDILDTSGTLYAMADFAGLMDENNDFPGSRWAFITDSIATMFGSVIGTSTVTTYIESAAGIEEGARTGLSTVFVGFLFFVSLFFSPLIAAIPPWATGGALIIVGASMMKSLTKVDWSDYSKAIPAFFAITMMPFTYSIANGILFGLGFYIVINGTNFILDKIFPDSSDSSDVSKVDETVKQPISEM